MAECDTDDIIKRLKVLDSLKQLRENMGTDLFSKSFPELGNLNGRLDELIAKHESELNAKISECGNLDGLKLEVENEIPETEALEIPIDGSLGDTTEI